MGIIENKIIVDNKLKKYFNLLEIVLTIPNKYNMPGRDVKEVENGLKDNILFDKYEVITPNIINQHSCGYFIRLLVQSYYARKENEKSLNYNEIQEWINCKSHGLVHGLFTGFLSMW